MTFAQILEYINVSLAGEMLQYQDVSLFLDKAIDAINEELNSTFPVFSTVHIERNVYADADGVAYFPDKYIRNVVVPFVAYQFYVVDEEGVHTAPAFFSQYKEGLFKMARDYSDLVPEIYKQDSEVGSKTVDVDFAYQVGDGTVPGTAVAGTGGMWPFE